MMTPPTSRIGRAARLLADAAGIALIEVLMCSMVLGIGVIGLALMFAAGQGFIRAEGDNRVALFLPHQKPFSGIQPVFPRLTDSARVAGVQYGHFACPQGSSCTAPGTPSTAEFFVSRAANVMDLTQCPTCGPIIASLGSTTGLTDSTAAFVFGQGDQYAVVSVPRFWLECKRRRGDTLPSGLCSYGS